MPTKISPCCLSGHLHSGSPTGREIKVAELDAYVTGDEEEQKVLLFITDIFGYKLANVRLLADGYAKTGHFKVIVPDYFNGDYITTDHMKALTPLHSDAFVDDEVKGEKLQAAFSDVGPWLARHTDDIVGPKIAKTVEVLSHDSSKLAVLGFCWGGRQAIMLANGEHSIDAIVANHPSYTEFPAAFEAIQKPALIQVGDNDSLFPSQQVEQVKDVVFAGRKDAKVVVYPGAVHGFSIRSDQNNKAEVQLKEDATISAINFLRHYL